MLYYPTVLLSFGSSSSGLRTQEKFRSLFGITPIYLIPVPIDKSAVTAKLYYVTSQKNKILIVRMFDRVHSKFSYPIGT